MENKAFDVIVVGAGVAGLSASYYLKEYGINHIVFERGRIGESWRSQRWDSFRINSINKLNSLGGKEYEGPDPYEFQLAPSYVSSFENYVSTFHLPVMENSRVVSLKKPSTLFEVMVSSGGNLQCYYSKNVIIASGYASEIRIPDLSKKIGGSIKQLHAGEYRNPQDLPPGAVLVVGSAQSGCQIADDLVNSGRKVFLSTSMVARVPRWYRGKDIMEWLIEMKFFEARAQDIKDPAMLNLKPPQITGTGGNKYTISLQWLAKKGVTILGRTDSANAEQVFLQPNAAMHVKFADEFSIKIKSIIDDYILKNGITADPPEPDEADMPDKNASCASSLTTLDFKEQKINTIIWCTGFVGDFSYIHLPIFDDEGNLKQEGGLTIVPGLFFLGYPWLRFRHSLLIFGIKSDAKFVVDRILQAVQVKDQPVSGLV